MDVLGIRSPPQTNADLDREGYHARVERPLCPELYGRDITLRLPPAERECERCGRTTTKWRMVSMVAPVRLCMECLGGR